VWTISPHGRPGAGNALKEKGAGGNWLGD
jgi:hypothetical protein